MAFSSSSTAISTSSGSSTTPSTLPPTEKSIALRYFGGNLSALLDSFVTLGEEELEPEDAKDRAIKDAHLWNRAIKYHLIRPGGASSRSDGPTSSPSSTDDDGASGGGREFSYRSSSSVDRALGGRSGKKDRLLPSSLPFRQGEVWTGGTGSRVKWSDLWGHRRVQRLVDRAKIQARGLVNKAILKYWVDHPQRAALGLLEEHEEEGLGKAFGKRKEERERRARAKSVAKLVMEQWTLADKVGAYYIPRGWRQRGVGRREEARSKEKGGTWSLFTLYSFYLTSSCPFFFLF